MPSDITIEPIRTADPQDAFDYPPDITPIPRIFTTALIGVSSVGLWWLIYRAIAALL